MLEMPQQGVIKGAVLSGSMAVVGAGERSAEREVTVRCCWQEGWTDGRTASRRDGQPAKASADFSLHLLPLGRIRCLMTRPVSH